MFVKFFESHSRSDLGKLIPRENGIEIYDRYIDETTTRLLSKPLFETTAFLIKNLYSENIEKTGVIYISLPNMKSDLIKQRNFQIQLIEKISMLITSNGKSYLDRKYYDIIILQEI